MKACEQFGSNPNKNQHWTILLSACLFREKNFFRLNINDTKPRLHHCITKSAVTFSWIGLMDLLVDGNYSATWFLKCFLSIIFLTRFLELLLYSGYCPLEANEIPILSLFHFIYFCSFLNKAKINLSELKTVGTLKMGHK